MLYDRWARARMSTMCQSLNLQESSGVIIFASGFGSGSEHKHLVPFRVQLGIN